MTAAGKTRTLAAVRAGLGPAVVLTVIGLIVYDHVTNAPKARAIQTVLPAELDSIAPLPGAVLRDRAGSYKARRARVDRTYNTTASYTQIRGHYDAELTKHGWSFHREHRTRVWFRDLGGMETQYCKGSYTASLQYAGRSDGWTFSLDPSWGGEALVDEWTGRICK